MKKKRILIIGKNGLIASHIFQFLKRKKNLFLKRISFNDFKNNYSKLYNLDYIISCSSNKYFVNNLYKEKNDYDFFIASKLKSFSTKLIIISSRKIYKLGDNLNENSIKRLKTNYSKNKFISENKIKKILYDRYLILRLPNLLGLRIKKCKRKLHKTYLDLFLEKVKDGFIYDNGKLYKDFLPIEIFCKIVFKLIYIDAKGTFNVSIGKKVFLSQLNNWLNFYNKNRSKLVKIPNNKNKNFNQDIFYLNNSKLLKKINMKLRLTDIKRSSLSISKKIFYEK